MRLFLCLLLLASTVLGATKADLKIALQNSGDYIEVGQPILKTTRGITALNGLSAKKYEIAVLIQGSTTIVSQKIYLIWVLDDNLVTENAYFLNIDPTITIPTVTSFRSLVIAKMENLGVEGTVIEQGSIGNKEWVLVNRYGSAPNGAFIVTKYKITRTDGTAWQLDSLVQ